MSISQGTIKAIYGERLKLNIKESRLAEITNTSATNTTLILTTSNFYHSAESIVHYLYGCTNYDVFGFTVSTDPIHCDPIPNDFESYAVFANYTKVASATRQPDYMTVTVALGTFSCMLFMNGIQNFCR